MFPASAAWSTPMPAPAYNAVTPRTTLQPTPTAVGLPRNRDTAWADRPLQSSMSATPEKPKKVDWGPAVREYVRRAFESKNAIKGISGADMQAKLKETISYFAERGEHETMDWGKHPLPQQLLLSERKTMALANGIKTTSIYDTNGSTNHTVLPSPKKRKSQDPDELAAQQTEANVPPWRKANLDSRITFAQGHNEKRQKKNAVNGDAFSKFDQADLDKRRQRFQLGHNGSNPAPPWVSPQKEDEEMTDAPVVGTNQALEKGYFRLTAPPKPETVRPVQVLEKTLAMLLKKWKTDKNYNYTCNQFKSLRQDLTVQHVKNAFTVKVYESHARIALEMADLGEYNQCQTQLKALYAQNLGGSPDEFKAYRMLYSVYTCNKTDLNDMLAELTHADKSQMWIKHALDVRSSLALGNYHKFFKLYLQADNMGSYLMDMFVERERFSALANMSRG
jgi:hypothetical protein